MSTNTSNTSNQFTNNTQVDYSKIINPNTNWGLNAKPMTAKEIQKKMKHLYLKEEFESIKNPDSRLEDESRFI